MEKMESLSDKSLKLNIKFPWHIEHRERHKENCKKYQLAHPEKQKGYNKKWRDNNKEKYNEMCKINQRKYDTKKRAERKNKKMENEKSNADKNEQ